MAIEHVLSCARHEPPYFEIRTLAEMRNENQQRNFARAAEREADKLFPSPLPLPAPLPVVEDVQFVSLE